MRLNEKTKDNGSTKAREPWEWERIRGLKEDVVRIGQAIKNAREKKGKTLQELSDLIAKQHPTRSTITRSQLSKIERGEVNPHLSDIKLLSLALEVDLNELLEPGVKPWFVVRQSRVDQWLDDIAVRKRSVARPSGWHRAQVDQGIYRYVPLEGYEDGLVLPEDSSGTFAKTVMRPSVLCIKVQQPRKSAIEQALESHRGEEIMFVLEGEVYFWYAEPDGKLASPVPLRKHDCLRLSSELPHVFFAAPSSLPTEYAKVLHIFSDPLFTEPTVVTTG